MIISATISNAHPRGFAFAITDEGDQIFIPPHVVIDQILTLGDRREIQVVPNPDQHHRDRTQWLAVSFSDDAQLADTTPTESDLEAERAASWQTMPAEIHAAADALNSYNAESRDEAVYEYICNQIYCTSTELGNHIGADARTAANSAMRLFNAGRIAKADVYGRVGLKRATMILWAKSADDFVSGDDQ
mgnify:CR=1 FL=1|tara:strand:- start:2087 stop:2653 length:567 start_codon:yes stop_codon:yes gene_type:complete